MREMNVIIQEVMNAVHIFKSRLGQQVKTWVIATYAVVE